MQCPECKANNRPNASFCIECGEPLELNNAPEVARARPLQPAMEAAIPYRGPFGGSPDHQGQDNLPFPASMIAWIPRPFNPLGWGLEVRITVLVLLVAVGYDLLSQSIAQSDASNYQRGLQAEQQKHWHDAANLLKPLALKNYQDAANHYKNVEQQAGEFDHYDNWAQGDKLDGSLIRAALYYKQANQIEPGYDGVDKALTETLANAGQILYQKSDGLYLADATGVPLSALPGSDAQTEVLAVSADSQYVAYTGFDISQPPTQTQVVRPSNIPGGLLLPGRINLGGVTGTPTWQVATRKVYVRNLISGATESFDARPDQGPNPGLDNSLSTDATFVNNDKGLVFSVYRYDSESSTDVADIYYFDIAANAALRHIAVSFHYALPEETDTHLYYEAVETNTFRIGDSIVSYDLNSGKSNIIAHSDGNIARIWLGGNLAATPDTRTLFYVASEDNRLRIYSKLPPDASTSSLLVDNADDNANIDAQNTNITIAPDSGQAIAIKWGVQQEGWLLQPAVGKAINLRDMGWGLLMSNPLSMQYSPDGSKVLVQGTDGQSNARVWFSVVDNSLQLNFRPSFLLDPAYLQWLNDGKHLDAINVKGFSIIDTVSGQQPVFVARKTSPRSEQGQLTLLPDNQTLLYTADDGVYISDVDGQYPIKVLSGATAAWLIPATK